MKMHVLVLILLAVFCIQLHADAQLKIVTHDDFLVYKIQMALDTKTGNVGIFYAAYNSSNRDMLNAFFALVGFNSSGTGYIISRLKIGTNIPSGSICYNSKLEKFCVAYSIGTFPKSRIKLQFFNASGKFSGNVDPFEKNKHYDKAPLIVYNEKRDNYFLGWSRGETYSLRWDDPLGLLATTLDGNGKATGEIKSYAKIKETSTYQHIPEFDSISLNRNNNKYFALYKNPKVVNYSRDDTSSTVEFMTLKKKGAIVTKRTLADRHTDGRYWFYTFSEIPETGSGKRGDTILAWTKERKPYYQIIGPKGNRKAGHVINGVGSISSVTVAHSNTQNRSILVFEPESYGPLLVKHLDSSGHLTGQSIELIRNRNINHPRALWNPKINKFVVLWTVRFLHFKLGDNESLWITTTD